MTAPSHPPFVAPSRIDPRPLAVAVTALGGAVFPLLSLEPMPSWWVASWAPAAGLHAVAMLHFRRRWVPALGVAALLGAVLVWELEYVAQRWMMWALALTLGLLLTLFFAAPAAAARRAFGAPAGDALDRALVPLSLWLGVLALLTMALSETEVWTDVRSYSPQLVGDGRLPWIAALSALSVGASLAGATLFRDARRIRFLGAIGGDRSYELIPWSEEGGAGVSTVPYLSGAVIRWAVVPRVREGPSVFRERGSGDVVAWLPCDLPGARRLLRRRAAFSLVLLGAETAGLVGIAVAFLFHMGPLTGVTAVAPDRHHTCALRRSGDVVCWGWNEFGQLGDGTRRHSYAPVQVRGVEEAVSLHPPCALLRSGEVRCWSSLFEGPREAHPIEGLPPARLLATHDSSGCVVTREDDVICWAEPGPPVSITKAPGAVTLILDTFGDCVELPDRIQCWRHSLVRRGPDLFSPCVRPSGARPALPDRLALVGSSLFELTGEGQVYGWRVPVTGAGPCEGPVVLDGMDGVVRIAGDLALGSDGSVRSWRPDEEVGSCILGETWLESGAVDVQRSNDTSCAVRDDGTAWCWGINEWGQIGDGTRRSREFPTLVRR